MSWFKTTEQTDFEKKVDAAIEAREARQKEQNSHKIRLSRLNRYKYGDIVSTQDRESFYYGSKGRVTGLDRYEFKLHVEMLNGGACVYMDLEEVLKDD